MIEMTYEPEAVERITGRRTEQPDEELRTKVDMLCELAKDDVQLRPETILKIFGREEDASELVRKRARDRENFLAWMKEDIALGGGEE